MSAISDYYASIEKNFGKGGKKVQIMKKNGSKLPIQISAEKELDEIQKKAEKLKDTIFLNTVSKFLPNDQLKKLKGPQNIPKTIEQFLNFYSDRMQMYVPGNYTLQFFEEVLKGERFLFKKS